MTFRSHFIVDLKDIINFKKDMGVEAGLEINFSSHQPTGLTVLKIWQSGFVNVSPICIFINIFLHVYHYSY